MHPPFALATQEQLTRRTLSTKYLIQLDLNIIRLLQIKKQLKIDAILYNPVQYKYYLFVYKQADISYRNNILHLLCYFFLHTLNI